MGEWNKNYRSWNNKVIEELGEYEEKVDEGEKATVYWVLKLEM